jgi:ABC-type taurine transport system substrate-binding protein
MNPQTPREAEMDKLGGINPEDVTQYVDGLDWPAKKEQVADKAQSNGAPDGAVEKIRNSSVEEFSGPQDVVSAVQG